LAYPKHISCACHLCAGERQRILWLWCAQERGLAYHMHTIMCTARGLAYHMHTIMYTVRGLAYHMHTIMRTARGLAYHMHTESHERTPTRISVRFKANSCLALIRCHTLFVVCDFSCPRQEERTTRMLICPLAHPSYITTSYSPITATPTNTPTNYFHPTMHTHLTH
jgi:hypothetical protein